MSAAHAFDYAAFIQAETTKAEGSTDASLKSSLPSARIKRIIKAEPDIPMVAGEVTTILSKACEVFIAELSQRAYAEAQKDNRRTIGRADVVRGCTQSDTLDFLVDILGEEAVAIKQRNLRQP